MIIYYLVLLTQKQDSNWINHCFLTVVTHQKEKKKKHKTAGLLTLNQQGLDDCVFPSMLRDHRHLTPTQLLRLPASALTVRNYIP